MSNVGDILINFILKLLNSVSSIWDFLITSQTIFGYEVAPIYLASSLLTVILLVGLISLFIP